MIRPHPKSLQPKSYFSNALQGVRAERRVVEGEVQLPEVWTQVYDVQVDLLMIEGHSKCAYGVLEKRGVFGVPGIRKLDCLFEGFAMVYAAEEWGVCE